jgi:hypothetical protein
MRPIAGDLHRDRKICQTTKPTCRPHIRHPKSYIQHPQSTILNYFAHGLPFLDNPYFLAGTAVPDWLTVSDRDARLRSKHVAEWKNDPAPAMASLARGILQHLRDDARFHETRAFAETSLEITIQMRDALEHDGGFRPSFLGHLLTELLLDATLIARAPVKLAAYYRALEAVDAMEIQALVNRMSPRPVVRLGFFIQQFLAARILSDYLDDAKLGIRLNQIMHRVGLAPLPASCLTYMPAARRMVADRCDELLPGIPAPET